MGGGRGEREPQGAKECDKAEHEPSRVSVRRGLYRRMHVPGIEPGGAAVWARCVHQLARRACQSRQLESNQPGRLMRPLSSHEDDAARLWSRRESNPRLGGANAASSLWTTTPGASGSNRTSSSGASDRRADHLRHAGDATPGTRIELVCRGRRPRTFTRGTTGQGRLRAEGLEPPSRAYRARALAVGRCTCVLPGNRTLLDAA